MIVAGTRGQTGSRGLVKHRSDVLDASVVCAAVGVCVLESELDMVGLLAFTVGNSCRGSRPGQRRDGMIAEVSKPCGDVNVGIVR